MKSAKLSYQCLYSCLLMPSCISSIPVVSSDIPAPGSEQLSFFSSLSPPKQAEMQNAQLPTTGSAPALSLFCSHSPHRKASRAVLFWADPVSTHISKTVYSVLPSFNHFPIQYLFDQLKAAALHYSLLSRRGDRLLLLQLQTGPSAWVAILNKNARSRDRGSRRLMCQLPAQTGPAVPTATPSYMSCDGLLGHFLLLVLPHHCSFHPFLCLRGKLLTIFLSSVPEGFCQGLDKPKCFRLLRAWEGPSGLLSQESKGNPLLLFEQNSLWKSKL